MYSEHREEEGSDNFTITIIPRVKLRIEGNGGSALFPRRLTRSVVYDSFTRSAI